MSKIPIPSSGFDLSFRPRTYWEHADPIAAIVSNVKGTRRRAMITDILTAEGERRELYDATIGPLPSEYYEADAGKLKQTLGALHPAWLGGEYLPRYLPGEVEIARIELASSTADVYSVRARRRSATSRIEYRVVDEYPEYGPWTLRVKSSAKPLNFRGIVRLIDTARSAFTEGAGASDKLTDVIRNSLAYDGDVDAAFHFVTVNSPFYPNLSEYYAKAAQQWWDAWRLDHEDFDDDEAEEAETDKNPMRFSRP